MDRIERIVAAFLVSMLCGVVMPVCWAAEKKGPSAEELKKIEGAAAKVRAVRPAKARRLLVFSRSWGHWHTSIPYGEAAVKAMAKATGAFEVVATDDASWFEPEKLKGFDAVFFNNTNREIFLPEKVEELSVEQQAKVKKRDEALKRSFVEFLARGKGLAVTHAGVASFREWPEYGKIIGARFDNHPWTSGSTVTFKVDEPGHPVAKAFSDGRFVARDEVYQVKGLYSREKLRVLLSVDTDRTNMEVEGLHREDKDFGISWVKSYGRGRVFYCALGHDHELFWNPVVLQHYLDGIQFALGDSKGDTTPSSKAKAGRGKDK